jgi:hypothetical protein
VTVSSIRAGRKAGPPAQGHAGDLDAAAGEFLIKKRRKPSRPANRRVIGAAGHAQAGPGRGHDGDPAEQPAIMAAFGQHPPQAGEEQCPSNNASDHRKSS